MSGLISDRLAGREIAALLWRRWTGEPLSSLSEMFGLAHPDSSSNLIRRARERSERSTTYQQALEEIEWTLGLKTETQV